MYDHSWENQIKLMQISWPVHTVAISFRYSWVMGWQLAPDGLRWHFCFAALLAITLIPAALRCCSIHGLVLCFARPKPFAWCQVCTEMTGNTELSWCGQFNGQCCAWSSNFTWIQVKSAPSITTVDQHGRMGCVIGSKTQNCNKRNNNPEHFVF